MSKAHVLIAEDERKIAATLASYLEHDDFRVSQLHEGSSVEDFIALQQPDFLILDLMLPGKNGLDICRDLRQHSAIPILMLTARVEEVDRLLGLELGADDYICKPFSPREIVARVHTILRRVRVADTGTQRMLKRGPLCLQLDSFDCFVDGQRLELTKVEFGMLKNLLLAQGQILSRQQLMAAVYTDSRVVSERTIDSHIKNLRRKLTPLDPIQSIYGAGYRLLLPP